MTENVKEGKGDIFPPKINILSCICGCDLFKLNIRDITKEFFNLYRYYKEYELTCSKCGKTDQIIGIVGISSEGEDSSAEIKQRVQVCSCKNELFKIESDMDGPDVSFSRIVLNHRIICSKCGCIDQSRLILERIEGSQLET